MLITDRIDQTILLLQPIGCLQMFQDAKGMVRAVSGGVASPQQCTRRTRR